MENVTGIHQSNTDYSEPEVLVLRVEPEEGFLTSVGNAVPEYDDNADPGVNSANNVRSSFPVHSF